jgi:hypothetical protein
MMQSALELLYRVSYRAEKLFKRRGHLQAYLFMTIDRAGLCQSFENVCDHAPDTIADRVVLDVMRRELALEFSLDHVVAFACAYPATEVSQCAPSFLHVATEQRRLPVVALEAHSADAHLRSHREIVRVGGKPRLAALAPVETDNVCQFGDLLPSLVST